MSRLDQPSEIAQKRYYPAITHSLSEIDRAHKTALCTVCGFTAIHVPISPTGKPTRVSCVARYQELIDRERKIRSKKARLKPGWKPRHLLSEIDTEKRTGICSICGSTDIYKHIAQGVTYYLCAKSRREYGHRKSGSSRTLPIHKLSQVDDANKTAVCSVCGFVKIYVSHGKNQISRRCSKASVATAMRCQKKRLENSGQLIYKYKVDHGCNQCGYNEDPLLLNLYSQDQDKKELKMGRLFKLKNRQLMRELTNREVLCVNCHAPKPQHNLKNIDQEQRTAICSTCGMTEIVIVRNHNYPHRKPMIYCKAKMREKNGTGVRRYREKKRLQDPNWKPKHKVSQIDLKTMRGVCTICGPTDILKNTIHKGKGKDTFYRCATGYRKQAREAARLQYQSIKAQKVQSDVVGDR